MCVGCRLNSEEWNLFMVLWKRIVYSRHIINFPIRKWRWVAVSSTDLHKFKYRKQLMEKVRSFVRRSEAEALEKIDGSPRYQSLYLEDKEKSSTFNFIRNSVQDFISMESTVNVFKSLTFSFVKRHQHKFMTLVLLS